MVDLSAYSVKDNKPISDKELAFRIVNYTLSAEYAHAEYNNPGKVLSIGEARLKQLLPMPDLIAAAKTAYPQSNDIVELADYAIKYAVNYMQVIFYAVTGLELDVILIAMLGYSQAELEERSPLEAKWYAQAHRIGVARGLLDASASMVSKAGKGDLPSQKLFLEKQGYLAGAGIEPGRYSSDFDPKPKIIVPADVASHFDEVFESRF